MDRSSSPIAKRTRAQEDRYLRAEYEKRRKQNGGDGEVGSCRDTRESSEIRVRDFVEVDRVEAADSETDETMCLSVSTSEDDLDEEQESVTNRSGDGSGRKASGGDSSCSVDVGDGVKRERFDSDDDEMEEDINVGSKRSSAVNVSGCVKKLKVNSDTIRYHGDGSVADPIELEDEKEEEEDDEEEEEEDDEEVVVKSNGDENNPVSNGKARQKRKTYDIIHDSVAQRTRSRSGLGSCESREMKKLGTLTQPICFDSEGMSSTSNSSDDEEDEDDMDINNAPNDTEAQLGGEEKSKLRTATKRKYVRASKGTNTIRNVIDKILKEGEALRHGLHNENVEQESDDLPRKFNFGVKKSKPEEKSDYEKEMDLYWDQMEFALRSNEIGSFASHTVDIQDEDVQHDEANPYVSCQLGKHDIVINEQIGKICRFCSFVELEIRYVVPSVVTSSRDAWNKNCTYGNGDFSLGDEIPFQGKCGDSKGFAHTTGTVWDICTEIRNKMHSHQKEGFEFMWKNLAGGIDLDVIRSCSSDDLGGCIISHAPGTGKSFMTIAFLKSYMEVDKKCLPLLIAPRSMLLTWEEEFRKWEVDIPFHNLSSSELSGEEHPIVCPIVGRVLRNRVVKLRSWIRGKSILGVSYSLFERLAGEKPGKNQDREPIRKFLLEKPSLLILDEGHTPRNERSLIWKALQNVKTDKRIILSGTPFQNDFVELYNTLRLVRPKFVNKIRSETREICQRASKLRGRRAEETKEKWASLTSSIGKHANDASVAELRTIIAPFVHVYTGSILKQDLPGLRGWVIYLNPTSLQKQILEELQGVQNPFEHNHPLALVSLHPSLLAKCSWSPDEKTLIDRTTSESFRLNPNEGVKTRFLMELIRLSEAMNEKVLVFSQFVEPFVLIKDQLQSVFNWTAGKEVAQMDGTLNLKVRQSLMRRFNDPDNELRVLLASTKACNEGISLIGASRIVLLDVVYNPSVEKQATSRAYRLGQKKIVFSYHLITSGTLEADKHHIQTHKDKISNLLFSTANEGTDKLHIKSTVAEDKILDEMVGHDKLRHIFDKIIPKETDLS